MTTPMIPEQRQQEILRMLQGAGVLSTRELTDAMQVSHMTVRRDIAALESSGLVTPVQGGVRLVDRPLKEPPRDRQLRSTLELPSKRAIAARAASMVTDDSVVFLDAGTTCEAVVPHLLTRSNLTVVTNDFTTVAALSPHAHIDVIHTGGLVDHHRLSAHGPLGVAVVQQLAIDLYLMSAGAWAIAEGVTVPEADTALLKRAVLEVSHRSLLLADSTKLGAYERYRVAPLNRLDVVVTDDRISAEAVAGIRNLGPEVELVSA
ncbi:DeoR/GlpR family DNA-binding transcription regulator [Micropruina sonneratiae]|uniref:DeoR/GlpR family DNA-binding transcription regulator n=1 Tax=Micropruina sonneratiae TaxID=2986940 RepID=UPI0022276B9B|nr:DeoR/GlpR family DNA-binding transcription regulator [Micropruina sp. KQZ13P-5]MCW3158621.1 DeoR/GlpR family DNA-binding transcription regulator [Micropruina sp. KQZ13P-5]